MMELSGARPGPAPNLLESEHTRMGGALDLDPGICTSLLPLSSCSLCLPFIHIYPTQSCGASPSA